MKPGGRRCSDAMNSLAPAAVSSSSPPLPPNLCTSEQISDSAVPLSLSTKSCPLAVRQMCSFTPLKTFSICSSSSVRSVTTSTRAPAMFSRIHLASQTMVRLLPLPWVCQRMPPSRRWMKSCAAFTPKYWFWRHSFLVPASNTTKSCISSSKRTLSQTCRMCRSSKLSSAA